jgi:hypothetical protein
MNLSKSDPIELICFALVGVSVILIFLGLTL